MRTTIKISTILLFLISCQNQINKTDQKNVYRNETQKDFLNTEKEVILINTEWNNYLLEHYNYKQWEPNIKDFQILKETLNKAIQNNKFDFLKKPIIKSVNTYYRQYIPLINENGERIIRINAFCLIPEIPPSDTENNEWIKMDWKNEFVMILDGGSCFWQIKINIDEKEYFDFRKNGV